MVEELREVIEGIGWVIDAAGVAVIVVGLAWAAVLAVSTRGDAPARYSTARQTIGRAILLGLEVLIAADIVRTVAVEPTVENLVVLGMIVLVRTFLSFTIILELEGRWPWQQGASGDSVVTVGHEA